MHTYKRGGTAFALALLAAFALLLAQGIVVLVFPDPFALEALAVMEFIPGVLAVLILLAFGARNALQLNGDRFKLAIRLGALVIIIAAVLMVFDAVGYVSEGYNAYEDWPVRIALVAILCVGTGLFEEGVFRGLLFGGLMALFGKSRAGVFAAAILSALIFGAAHIIPDGSTAYDAVSVTQMVLKTLEAGMLGFFLAALLLHTRSFWGIAALHALNNFLLMALSIGLFGETLDTDYVIQGDDATAVIVLYSIIVLAYIPLVVKGAKMLRAVELPEYGPLPTRKGVAAEMARGRGGALTDAQITERLQQAARANAQGGYFTGYGTPWYGDSAQSQPGYGEPAMAPASAPEQKGYWQGYLGEVSASPTQPGNSA